MTNTPPMTDTLTDDALLVRLRYQARTCEVLLDRLSRPCTRSDRVSTEDAHRRAEDQYAILYDEAKRRGIADRLELPDAI